MNAQHCTASFTVDQPRRQSSTTSTTSVA